MELWIPITIVAAFLQNIRSGLQKHLTGTMGTTGVTFVRFGFGMPFVLILLAVLHWGIGYTLPPITPQFLFWCTIGGGCQISATFLLVHLFSLRNFAAGTAYSRTEPVMAAISGFILFGEPVGPRTLAAIILCVAGVMLLSLARQAITALSVLTALTQRTALIGLASGFLFGLSAVSYRGASTALGGPNVLMQGAVTLGVVITGQTLVMLIWIALREPRELPRIRAAWRPAVIVGLAGAAASLGWFTAMTLQNAAIVKALAQVEMLFTVATSILIFRERIAAREIGGCALIVAGLLVLVLWR